MSYPRNIFIVNAYQVTQDGTYQKLNGFPKAFDSESYDHDIDTALMKATSSFAATWSTFCDGAKSKQVQTVTLDSIDGFRIDQKTVGQVADVEPVPEPKLEPEET